MFIFEKPDCGLHLGTILKAGFKRCILTHYKWAFWHKTNIEIRLRFEDFGSIGKEGEVSNSISFDRCPTSTACCTKSYMLVWCTQRKDYKKAASWFKFKLINFAVIAITTIVVLKIHKTNIIGLSLSKPFLFITFFYSI